MKGIISTLKKLLESQQLSIFDLNPVDVSIETVPVEGKPLHNFNINKDFDYLNEIFFNRQLKKPPKFVWFKKRNPLGMVSSTLSGDLSRLGKLLKKYEKTVNYLGLTNYYDMTRTEYLSNLAHEMIHLWQSQNGIKDDGFKGHGREFREWRDRINRMNYQGIKIDIQHEDFWGLKPVNQDIKPLCVYLFYNTIYNRYSIGVFTKEMFDKNIDYFKEVFKNAASDKRYSRNIYLVSHIMLDKYPKQRKPQMKLYSINDELLDFIKKEGKLLL